MKTHPDPRDLSAYLDGELTRAQRGPVKRHLQTCSPCREELSSLSRVKASLAASSRKRLPADIEGAWARRLTPDTPPTWSERLREALALPQVLVPALAAAALLMVLNARSRRVEEPIPITSLAAEHSRYEAEGLVPSGDLAAANFSSELFSLHDQD